MSEGEQLKQIELKAKSGRASLKLIRRDMYQIFSVGVKIEKGDKSLLTEFKAMHPRALSLLNDYTSEFKSLQAFLIEAGAEQLFPLEADFKDRSEVNSFYYESEKVFQSLTPALSPLGGGTTTPAPPPAGGAASFLSCSYSAKSRLPKISLPKFSGLLPEWPKFKQLFVSMIHDNNDLSVLEKFHYLILSLTGEPLTLISAYTVNEANFPKAWDSLLQKYDSKRLLATAYIQKILDFRPLKGHSSLQVLESFISIFAKNVSALQSLEIKDEADFLWLTLALNKLDKDTRQRFESLVVKDEWPTFGKLVEFIYDRVKVLQLSGQTGDSPHSDSGKSDRPSKAGSSSRVLITTGRESRPPSKSLCACAQRHPLHECPVFRDKSPGRRRAYLSGKRVCFNCLKADHFASECPSSRCCRSCNGRHHTLLHQVMSKGVTANIRGRSSPQPSSAINVDVPLVQNAEPPSDGGVSKPLIASVTGPGKILLGTAIALIADYSGHLQPIRVLIDPCAHFSLITAECARRLGLTWQATRQRPCGAGEVAVPNVKGTLHCKLHSRLDPELHIPLDPLVVSVITGNLPLVPLSPQLSSPIKDQALADPGYWKPGPIDFLLGNDVFMSILQGNVQKIHDNFGILNTIFGSVLMGNTDFPLAASQGYCLSIVDSPLSDELMSRFWEMEQVERASIQSSVDECEEHFSRTHYRDSTGRYVVSLPFKPGFEEIAGSLSDSKHMALKRFRLLEGKFAKNPIIKEKYSQFMHEYEELSHMSKSSVDPVYTIPHHAVFRPDDPDKKVRVVFDASMKTSVGSLNDWLLPGPKLQKDVADIIMGFRQHLIGITTDLVKMFRQVLVAPEDRRFQTAWWRPSPTDDPVIYELNTVTYGLTSSAFQANRVLKQLASDEGHAFPSAARVLNEDIYVDDALFGADSVQGSLRLKEELVALLAKGQFVTHKWKSNSPDFLRHSAEPSSGEVSLSKDDFQCTKILGMSWNPVEDVFFYEVKPPGNVVTKRGILSVIARLYDPLGFLAPITFLAKCLLQRLWAANLGWDEPPDRIVTQLWIEFSSNLHRLSEIKIPRYCLALAATKCHLLCFCDASQKGYAAVIYLRVLCPRSGVKVFLLKCKTRVAPLKTVSIPRLELCAAFLLTKLFLSVHPLLGKVSALDVLFFTDSTIVLSWLRLSPHTLQTFVGNRVSFIVNHTCPDQWYHVMSADNPADPASRGLMPNELKDCALWWKGPPWMSEDPLVPPSFPQPPVEIPEVRSSVVLLLSDKPVANATLSKMKESTPWLLDWMKQHSRYARMLRILAYAIRFICILPKLSGLRASGPIPGSSVRSTSCPFSQQRPLSLQELDEALKRCIRVVQHHEFAAEFSWANGTPLSRRLLSLSAFADEDGLLRVGGRLRHSELPFDARSPIILPGESHLTLLMVDHYHYVFFHLGNKALQALLLRKFWIFRLKQVVRSRISKCITCQRMRAQAHPPMMAPLPSARVRQGRPFLSVGVDYAGPFLVRQGPRRNSPSSKAYLCLFVCMSIKAVHLECVSSLSTEAFLAALDRFVARRGIPSRMFSDCGRNFIGASKQLKELFSWLKSSATQSTLSSHATSRGFEWQFNPPYSPHFGGLWETAVKAVKHHMHRVIGDQVLSFEELSTFFIRVEAVLNSRPLCPVDSDFSSSDVLTPGHFLIGSPLVSVPEGDVTHLKLNTLSRWQLIQSAVQHLWKRWHTEYLNTLQQRTKWFTQRREIRVGDLVLIPDPSSLPLNWPLARVVACHPGSDGIVRVVSLKYKHGIHRRSVHKLVPLKYLEEF